MDFIREIGYSLRYFFTGKTTHPHALPVSDSSVEAKTSGVETTPYGQYPNQRRMSFGEAFGVAEYQQRDQYPMSKTKLGAPKQEYYDPEERQRLTPSMSPLPQNGSGYLSAQQRHPQHHQQSASGPGRPLSDTTTSGEEMDLGYYHQSHPGHDAYAGAVVEEPTSVGVAAHGGAVQYPAQSQGVPYQQQYGRHGHEAGEYGYGQELQAPQARDGGSARDSFQAWTGPRAI